MIPNDEKFNAVYEDLFWTFDLYRSIALWDPRLEIDTGGITSFVAEVYDFLCEILSEYEKLTPKLWFKLMGIYGLMRSLSEIDVAIDVATERDDWIHLTALCHIFHILSRMMFVPKLWNAKKRIIFVPVDIKGITCYDECISSEYDPEHCEDFIDFMCDDIYYDDIYYDDIYYIDDFVKVKIVPYDITTKDLSELEAEIIKYNSKN